MPRLLDGLFDIEMGEAVGQPDAPAERPAQDVQDAPAVQGYINQAGGQWHENIQAPAQAQVGYQQIHDQYVGVKAYHTKPVNGSLLQGFSSHDLVEVRKWALDQARRMVAAGIKKGDDTDIVNTAKIIESYLFRSKNDTK